MNAGATDAILIEKKTIYSNFNDEKNRIKALKKIAKAQIKL